MFSVIINDLLWQFLEASYWLWVCVCMKYVCGKKYNKKNKRWMIFSNQVKMKWERFSITQPMDFE